MATELHDTLKFLTNKPEIAFQYQDDASTPWASVAGAHNGVPEAYRAPGKIRFIDQGDGKGVIEYWYKGGIEMENLVPRYENLESAVAYVEILEGLKADVQIIKSETEAFKDESLNAAGAVIKGVGNFNAVTGVATDKELGTTFIPVLTANIPNGSYLDIEVAGNITITNGTSIAVAVGGKLISRGTKWDYLPPTDSGYARSIENQFKIDAPKTVENLVPSSSSLLTWGKTGANTEAAADVTGLSNAVKLSDTSANTVHQIGSANINLVAGVPAAFSVFIEAGTKTRVNLSLGNAASWPGGTNPPNLFFDLVTGAFIGTIPGTVTNLKAIKIGNVYRILFVSTAHLTGTCVFRIGLLSFNTGGALNTIYVGDGLGHIFVSFPQVSYSSDFVPYTYNNLSVPISKTPQVSITADDVANFNGKVSPSQVEYLSVNKFIVGDVIENSLVNNTSFNVETNAGSARSSFFPVSPGDILILSGFSPTGKSIQFADASQVKLVTTPGINLTTFPQSIVIPDNCRFASLTVKRSIDAPNDYANIKVEKRTFKSILGAQIDFSGLATSGSVTTLEGRATTLEGRATALEGRVTINEADIVTLKANTPTGNLDFVAIAPEVVYVSDGSTNFNGRREPTRVYLSHFIRERIEIFLNKGANDYILNRDILNTADVNDYTVPLTIGGGKYVTKNISIPVKSIKSAVLAGQFIKLLYNGDSITAPQKRNGATVGAGSIWDMCLEVSAKNKYDNGNTGYDMIGIGRTNLVNTTANYKGSTVPVKGGSEGYGGWSAHNWLRHPFRLTTTDPNARQAGWDLLGLAAQTGHGFTNTWANNLLLANTCYGVNAPVISQYSYDLLRSQGELGKYGGDLGGWSGSGAQIARVQAWIDDVAENPTNPFFDITKTGSNRFSVAKYFERFRTRLEDGVTPATTTKGTKVTDVNAYIVCEFTHVIIGLGENDRNSFNNEPTPTDKWNKVMDDILELANEYRTQASFCFVGISLTDRPGAMFPERTPNYKGELYGSYIEERGKKWDLYAVYMSRISNLTIQIANKIFLIPTWHTMQPNSHNNTSFQTDEGTGQEIQVANSDMTHPGYYGMRSAGVSAYAWIAFTKTLS